MCVYANKNAKKNNRAKIWAHERFYRGTWKHFILHMNFNHNFVYENIQAIVFHGELMSRIQQISQYHHKTGIAQSLSSN